jgi:hypothetical protein
MIGGSKRWIWRSAEHRRPKRRHARQHQLSRKLNPVAARIMAGCAGAIATRGTSFAAMAQTAHRAGVRQMSMSSAKLLLSTVALFSFAAGMPGSASAETAIKLFRKGYQQIAEESSLSFDGCESGKRYAVGQFIFECDSYDYNYEYGDAYIIAKKISYGGTTSVSAYLCTDDDECYSGQLYSR